MATLQQDYLKTLQNNVGLSQKQLKRQLIKSQDAGVSPATMSLSNVPDSYNWGSRGTSGFRGAGWQNTAVDTNNIPEVDNETRSFLNGRIGEYTVDGQKQYGYYGDTDVYDVNKLNGLLTNNGFSYARGAEDPEYVQAGLDLPSVWKKPVFKNDQYDFTQKYGYDAGFGRAKGVDDYMASLGYTQDLGRTFDLQANKQLPGAQDTFTQVKDFYGKKSINDYLTSIGYQDYTDSAWKDYVGLVGDAGFAKTGGRNWWSGNVNNFATTNVNDPNKYLTDRWNSLEGNQISDYQNGYMMLNGQRVPDGFEYTQDGWRAPFGNGENPLPAMFNSEGSSGVPTYINGGYDFRGKIYSSKQEAEAARQNNLQQTLSNPAIRNEIMAQILTEGKLSGVFSSDATASKMVDSPWGPFAQQYANNRGRFGGDEKANQLTADQLKQVLGSKDLIYGGKTLGSLFGNPSDPYQDNWSDYSQSTSRNKLRTQKKTVTNWDYGDVGAGLKFNDPNWLAQNAYKAGNGDIFVSSDKVSSMPGAQAVDWYNRDQGSNTQKSATGLGKVVGTALNFVPVVGPMASMAFNAMNSGQGPTLAGMAGSLVGMTGLGGDLGKALGFTGNTANAIGNALIQGGLTTSEGLIKGDGLEKALKSGALSGLSGAISGLASGPLANTLGGAIGNSDVGKVLSSIVMRTGTKGLNNLLTNNKFGKGMGDSAVSGALMGLGNLYDRANKDSNLVQQRQQPQPQQRMNRA